MPRSRWGHKLATNDDDKIMLFGGMNLNSYCESVFYEIIIDDQAVIDLLTKTAVLKPEQKKNAIQQAKQLVSPKDS